MGTTRSRSPWPLTLMLGCCVLVAGCKKAGSETSEPVDDPIAELDRLEQLLRQAEGPAEDRTSTAEIEGEDAEPAAADQSTGERYGCGAICELREPICELRARICELNESHPDDPVYIDACERAIDDCTRATDTCESCKTGE